MDGALARLGLRLSRLPLLAGDLSLEAAFARL